MYTSYAGAAGIVVSYKWKVKYTTGATITANAYHSGAREFTTIPEHVSSPPFRST
jgi:hypothetical protein